MATLSATMIYITHAKHNLLYGLWKIFWLVTTSNALCFYGDEKINLGAQVVMKVQASNIS